MIPPPCVTTLQNLVQYSSYTVLFASAFYAPRVLFADDKRQQILRDCVDVAHWLGLSSSRLVRYQVALSRHRLHQQTLGKRSPDQSDSSVPNVIQCIPSELMRKASDDCIIQFYRELLQRGGITASTSQRKGNLVNCCHALLDCHEANPDIRCLYLPITNSNPTIENTLRQLLDIRPYLSISEVLDELLPQENLMGVTGPYDEWFPEDSDLLHHLAKHKISLHISGQVDDTVQTLAEDNPAIYYTGPAPERDSPNVPMTFKESGSSS